MVFDTREQQRIRAVFDALLEDTPPAPDLEALPGEIHRLDTGSTTTSRPWRAPLIVAVSATAVILAIGAVALVTRGQAPEPTFGSDDGTSGLEDRGDEPPTVSYPRPEAPYISSGAAPVELYGDIRAAYEAVSDIVELVPVQYHLAAGSPWPWPSLGDLRPVRSESGGFSIPGDADVGMIVMWVTSTDLFLDHELGTDLFLDHELGLLMAEDGDVLVCVTSVDLLLAGCDPWNTPDSLRVEGWDARGVLVAIGTFPDGREAASFTIYIQDGGVWIKRISIGFGFLRLQLEPRVAMPLSEHTMRQVAARIIEAIGGPAAR